MQAESRTYSWLAFALVLWLGVFATLGLFLATLLSGCSTVPIAHNTEAEAQEDAEVITRWLTTNRQFNVME